MIVPCPVNFWEIKKYPLTWAMIFINCFIFMLFFIDGQDSASWMAFFSDDNMTLTGRIYVQYLHELPIEKRDRLPAWVNSLQPETNYHYQSFGSWALRDSQFLDRAENLEINGDEVQLRQWHEGVLKFKNSYFDQMVFRLGLSQVNQDSLAWITYQFSHSGLMHLLSNMIYFLIIGTAVEAMIGAAGMVILYLAGGIFAGLFFLTIKSHGGAVPMVGASGSISALMSFYVIFEERLRIRFAYFVSLHPKHHGYIYLPTLWMIPLFIIADFSHHFSSIEGMGAGVAYTAHMGGTIFGIGVALVCRYLLPIKNNLLWEEVFTPEEPALIKPQAPWPDEE
jgi:membrane associated rhomboid family serine protease